jgi:hypothetical protein
LVHAADVEFSTGILQSGTNQLALLEAYSLDPATDATESVSRRMEPQFNLIHLYCMYRWRYTDPFYCFRPFIVVGPLIVA